MHLLKSIYLYIKRSNFVVLSVEKNETSLISGIQAFIIKKSRYFIIYAIYICLLSFLYCETSSELKFAREQYSELEDHFVIWAHSDIQPRTLEERKYYETALEDIKINIPRVDAALVAGDIIHWSNSPDVFDWYVKAKKKSSIKYWYEIAGNHDQKDFKNYKKYINMPLHYSVRIGNLLILCLSDENKKAETEISDEAFEWWKDMVVNNQDSIIITMTHAYLKESRLFGAFIPSRNIKHSERFARVLKNYRVDIWICGHTHLSHKLNGSINIVRELNGTLFLNVSAIRGGFYKDVESFLLFFKKGSNKVFVRSRNHEEKKYNERFDLLFELSRELELKSIDPVMKPFVDNRKIKINDHTLAL